MSTHDVPGAVAAHHDVLAMGCWAEHDDGSLIYVYSTEGDKVVYSMFDVSRDPVLEFRDAMSEKGFKKEFSWSKPGVSTKEGVQWTWHDKTPFDWDRVMVQFPSGPRDASAGATMTAAARIAERLKLRGNELREQISRPGGARTIMERVRDAIAAGRG